MTFSVVSKRMGKRSKVSVILVADVIDRMHGIHKADPDFEAAIAVTASAESREYDPLRAPVIIKSSKSAAVRQRLQKLLADG